MYRLPDHVQRWAELGRLVEPYVIDFYQRWYDTPVEPAYALQRATSARLDVDQPEQPGDVVAHDPVRACPAGSAAACTASASSLTVMSFSSSATGS